MYTPQHKTPACSCEVETSQITFLSSVFSVPASFLGFRTSSTVTHKVYSELRGRIYKADFSSLAHIISPYQSSSWPWLWFISSRKRHICSGKQLHLRSSFRPPGSRCTNDVLDVAATHPTSAMRFGPRTGGKTTCSA